MANVQLPSVNLEEQDTGKLLKQLINAYIMLTEELTFLLNNLDTRNINELNADIINAGTINAALVKIQTALMNGGFIAIGDQGLQVNDGTRDTMKVGLDGKPIMTGAEIRSKTGFPAVVMDPDSNLFGAYTDATRYIQMEAISVPTGSPRILLNSPDGNLWFYQQSTASFINAYNSDMRIQATKDINLEPGYFYNVYVPFDQLRDRRDSVSLDGKLAQKATSGASTGLSGSHNHGIPDGTVLQTAGGGTVTFRAAGSHSHSQT